MGAKGVNKWVVLALATGALALAGLVVGTPHVEASSGPTQVAVVNTPLPVSGTVGAAQSGPWTVTAQPAPTTILKLISTFGNYWTNDSGRLAVIDFVNANGLPEDYCTIYVRHPDNYEDTYTFSASSIGTLGQHVHASMVKIYVKPGDEVEFGFEGGWVNLNGHFE